MTSHRLWLAVALLGFLFGGGVAVMAMPAPAGADRAPPAMAPAAMRLAQAQAPQAPAPQSPAAPATSDQQSASDEPIGNVASLTGVATVVRNKDSIPLKLKDDIYLNDTVQTATTSSLGITFNDATTFHLSANASITIDSYVYEDGGNKNAGVFDIAKGTVAFVAAAVAKTGNMQITTPTATLGIRGTTGLVEVPENGASTSANNVNIKLYPDADGRVGHIDVNDRQGARLGSLTAGASGFSIRPGTGGARFAAVPLVISPQQQARDQGFVRQVHATQTVGRQIVTEQRAFRRANPGLNNRNNPSRQPNQNRPGQPGRQQPGENRPGQPQRSTTPNNRQGRQQPQPGQPSRPGQTTQPGTSPRSGQNTPATNPAQPGTSRSGQTGQPANAGRPGAPLPPNVRQPGRPQFAPGAPKPRQGPPPRDKRKKR